jgi:hypothetical protein
MNHNDDYDTPQRIVITIDLPGYLATHTIAAAALQSVLGHLEIRRNPPHPHQPRNHRTTDTPSMTTDTPQHPTPHHQHQTS